MQRPEGIVQNFLIVVQLDLLNDEDRALHWFVTQRTTCGGISEACFERILQLNERSVEDFADFCKFFNSSFCFCRTFLRLARYLYFFRLLNCLEIFAKVVYFVEQGLFLGQITVHKKVR